MFYITHYYPKVVLLSKAVILSLANRDRSSLYGIRVKSETDLRFALENGVAYDILIIIALPKSLMPLLSVYYKNQHH